MYRMQYISGRVGMFMNRKNVFGSLLLACAMLLAPLCFAGNSLAASYVIAVLDVEKVLKDSRAAAQGREHLAAAKKNLDAGWEQLKKKWAGKPEKQRKQVLAEGYRALNKQMANEETAANKVVLALMQKKVQEWRKNNDAQYVIAKQNLLDAVETADITAAVIALMDKETPKFSELPTVTVHEPKVEEAAKPAARPAPAKPAQAKPAPRKQQR